MNTRKASGGKHVERKQKNWLPKSSLYYKPTVKQSLSQKEIERPILGCELMEQVLMPKIHLINEEEVSTI